MKHGWKEYLEYNRSKGIDPSIKSGLEKYLIYYLLFIAWIIGISFVMPIDYIQRKGDAIEQSAIDRLERIKNTYKREDKNAKDN